LLESYIAYERGALDTADSFVLKFPYAGGITVLEQKDTKFLDILRR
jgi:hypothetical protein